jgi:chromosome segregation ATPase
MVTNLALTPLYTKKRELETEIASLASQKEIAQKGSREAQEAVTEINTRIGRLQAEIEQLEKQAEKAVTDAQEVVSGAIEAVRGATGAVEAAVAILKDLETRADAATARAEEARKVQEGRIVEIARENGVLDVRKRDLDIYKVRLQRKYDELGLGTLIL